MKILIDLKLIQFVIEPTQTYRNLWFLCLFSYCAKKIQCVLCNHYHISASIIQITWNFYLTWNCFALIWNCSMVMILDITGKIIVFYIYHVFSVYYYNETRAKSCIHVWMHYIIYFRTWKWELTWKIWHILYVNNNQ